MGHPQYSKTGPYDDAEDESSDSSGEKESDEDGIEAGEIDA